MASIGSFEEHDGLAPSTPGVQCPVEDSRAEWTLGAALWMLTLWMAVQLGVTTVLFAVLFAVYPGSLSHTVHWAVTNGLFIALFLAVADASFLALAYLIWLAPRRCSPASAIGLVASRLPLWFAPAVAVVVGLLLDGISVLTRQPVVPAGASAWFATPAGAAAMTLCLVSIVPLTEEAYFRGVLYAAIARRAGVAAAVLITALVFSAVHFGTYGVQWMVAFQAFVIGVALGVPRVRAGSLWPCIIAHAVVNLIASLEAIGHRLLTA